MNVMPTPIVQWLDAFELHPTLADHAAVVVSALPAEVRDHLMGDPAFRLFDYEPAPGTVMCVPVAAPSASGGGRSVVLKRTLTRRPPPFIRYVIAHELAHAYLRNAGRFAGEDPEHAADDLAAQWGFPRPIQ